MVIIIVIVIVIAIFVTGISRRGGDGRDNGGGDPDGPHILAIFYYIHIEYNYIRIYEYLDI